MTATRARSTFFVSLLALLTIALAIVASSAVVASASTRVGPETRVRANAHPISTRVGAHGRVVADQIGRLRPARYEFVSATGVATKEESLNLASEARTTHILEGDATGGGHQWPGLSDKTPFPESWSGTRIMTEISDVATDPAAWKNSATQGGRTVLTGVRDGVEIKVIVESSTGEIISGYPTNLPRNP